MPAFASAQLSEKSTEEPAQDQLASSVKEIERIVAEHCADCHGKGEHNGGLGFDDQATLLREADSGEVPLVPGNVDSSSIMARIRSTDENSWMPPEGERLSEESIAAFETWIREGGHALGQSHSVDSVDAEQHWSFRTVERSTPPQVADARFAKHPIDRFLEARRREQGIKAVDSATPETLLRRIAYGLTGLPPTIDEVESFEQSIATLGIDAAIEVVVDDYLSRRSYGERWGRHWMDWVRYADTAGDNSDFPIPQAYLYRNYIIDSLNADLPYDQFLTEQLAGDLLEVETLEDRNRQTIATGYLSMARRFGSLVERYPWHLTIEDTIDNVGRTMMGLTIACARCHDHKFDPVSTRDYYALYGIFESTQYPFPGIELFQSQHHIVPLLSSEEMQVRLQPFASKTQELEKKLNDFLAKSEARGIENARREAASSLSEKRRDRSEHDRLLIQARKAGEELAKHLKTIPDYPSAYAVQEAQPVDARVQIKGEPTRPGAVVPRGFPVVLGGYKLDGVSAASVSGRRELARWIASAENPLTARVIVNRVWQRHFGEGLVASTSDFGLRGQLPSHPKLLDWLATEFVESGWSLKYLHRLMLTSRSYRLSSIGNSTNMAKDPGNRLVWKFARQRLDAESIRDTLLTLSGNLDPSPMREPFEFPPMAEWTYTQHHPFKDEFASNRRSVYLMTKRLTSKTYFQTFDGPDRNVCTSDRDQSVTPLQALYFVNDGFFHEQAEGIAKRICAGGESVSSRVTEAYRVVMSRGPTPEELEIVAQHFAEVKHHLGGDDLQAWVSVTRSLLRLNEFLYVD